LEVAEQDRGLPGAGVDELRHALVHLLVAAAQQHEEVRADVHEEDEETPRDLSGLVEDAQEEAVHPVVRQLLVGARVDVLERRRVHERRVLRFDPLEEWKELLRENVFRIEPPLLEVLHEVGSELDEHLGLAVGVHGPQPSVGHEGLDDVLSVPEPVFVILADELRQLLGRPYEPPLRVEYQHGPLQPLDVVGPLGQALVDRKI
jgi:hypothetical protein